MTESKKRNLTLTSARKISTGFMTRIVDEEMMQAFNSVHVGGRIFVSVHPGVDNEGNPTQFAYLEFANKETVDAYQAKKGSNTFHGSRSKNRARQPAQEEL